MEGSIIVPGLTGTHVLSCDSRDEVVILSSMLTVDAHAHILQYGFKMQLMLDGCKSVQGLCPTRV